MAVNPYLVFDGNCRQAVEHYAQVFRTEQPRFQTFGEMPPDPNTPPLPDSAKNLVLHSQLTISSTPVMFSDNFPGMAFNAGNNISLTVVSKDRDEILRGFNGLKEGGTVHMDLQETFWTKLYGSLRDRFGVEWQFSLDSGETMM